MILTRPKMSYQQEKTKTFEIGSSIIYLDRPTLWIGETISGRDSKFLRRLIQFAAEKLAKIILKSWSFQLNCCPSYGN